MCPAPPSTDDVQKIHDALQDYVAKLERIQGFFKGPEVKEAQTYLQQAASSLKRVVNPAMSQSAEVSADDAATKGYTGPRMSG